MKKMACMRHDQDGMALGRGPICHGTKADHFIVFTVNQACFGCQWGRLTSIFGDAKPNQNDPRKGRLALAGRVPGPFMGDMRGHDTTE